MLSSSEVAREAGSEREPGGPGLGLGGKQEDRPESAPPQRLIWCIRTPPAQSSLPRRRDGCGVEGAQQCRKSKLRYMESERQETGKGGNNCLMNGASSPAPKETQSAPSGSRP